MNYAQEKYAELLRAGLARSLSLTWCQERDLDEVARRFGASLETGGLWATEDEIEELEEDDTVELVQLAKISDWTIAYEPNGHQGSRSAVLESLSSGSQALNIYWNVELDSSISYATDGVIATSFAINEFDHRSGTRPDALDDVLAEVGLRQDLTVQEFKARTLELAERISGQPLTTEWLRSPRYVFKIINPLPEPLVPPGYLNPRAPFLDEPEFARILNNPSPGMAPSILKQIVSTVLSISTLEGTLPNRVLQLIDHGEQFEGERILIGEELNQKANDLRNRMTISASGESERNQLDLESQVLIVLLKALNPSPIEAASAASQVALQLSVPTREHFMRLIVLNRISKAISIH
ncbi:DUF6461 domain-containing protein [Streptosporangium longisporum]|uniref:Uncharacterized protein n=1 Tax=Streptosporangium longisporum TaxID=46187 RepID=A0ABP6KSY6_9ACTN